MPAVIDSFTGEYRFLSNFWLCNIEVEGLTFPSVENAYQAAKSRDDARDAEFTLITPAVAKRLGRKLLIRHDWDRVKLTIMRDLLRLKFSDRELMNMLRGTGDALLVEGNTWRDTYWGVCAVSGRGENHLGKLLMEIRRGE